MRRARLSPRALLGWSAVILIAVVIAALAGLPVGVGAQASPPGEPISCVVTTSTATTIQAVGGRCIAPPAGLSIYVTDILFSTSAAGIAADAFPTLKTGTGGTCGTATAVVWGALTASAFNTPQQLRTPLRLTPANELCWINSTAGSKFLVVNGYIAP